MASARFNDDDSAYLSRTPSSAGNRKTWTWSGWVKVSDTDSDGVKLIDVWDDDNNRTSLSFGYTYGLFYQERDASTNVVRMWSNAKY